MKNKQKEWHPATKPLKKEIFTPCDLRPHREIKYTVGNHSKGSLNHSRKFFATKQNLYI